MVAEMVPERVLQPKAFSLMPLVWSVGSVFGPAFGGFFARPADQYPNLFGNVEFLKRYPFLLPNLMACCVFFVSFMTGLLFLKVSNMLDPRGVLPTKLTCNRKHLIANATSVIGVWYWGRSCPVHSIGPRDINARDGCPLSMTKHQPRCSPIHSCPALTTPLSRPNTQL